MGALPILDDPLRFDRPAPPAAVVIFGANGDLTQRKLMPALYRLAFERRLAPGFAVVGTSRTAMSDEEFRAKMRAGVEKFLEDSPFDAVLWEEFERGLYYLAGDIAGDELYTALAAKLAEVEKERHTGGNALFYLSTQPSYYARVAEGLGAAGLQHAPESGAWRRIIIEKPFGHDQQSARELNGRLHSVFDERDIYRIDHYLGKETVQNILAFRFGNGIFEPLWNRRYVNHVQITAAESIGVEGRGGYYQEAGALRDMIDPEPPDAGDGDHRHGASGRVRIGCRARRTGQAAALDSHSEAGRSGHARRGGPVRSGANRRRATGGLPRGEGRRAGLADRYLRGRDAFRRELALGGRPILHP
jgi:glucose-6-phosphate 1-dehydrogenase